MADDKGNAGSHGHSSRDQDGDQNGHEAPPSPKHHKKDAKKYVSFRSDDEDSSEMEVDETAKKDRKKLKKDRSNTFKEKFKSIKVKKREKESKEKAKDKEKEEKKEKKEKKKHKRSLSAGASLTATNVQSPPPTSPVFGVKLEIAVSRSKIAEGIELPTVFRECIYYLEEKGLSQEGLYRVSGIKSKIDELKYFYDHGIKFDLEADDIDANTIAGLLKQYLRELPSNLLTQRLQHVFDSLIGLKDEADQIYKMKQLLAELPRPNYTLLSWLFVHLDHVMKNFSETKMNIQNVSIVFSPTMNISHGVLYIILMHVDEIFPNVEITKYVEPVQQVTQNLGPKSPRSLSEELAKQEMFLDNLHEQMKQEDGNEDEVMEKMWEVQRTVTQLKRKLKTLRRSQPVRSATEDDSTRNIEETRPIEGESVRLRANLNAVKSNERFHEAAKVEETDRIKKHEKPKKLVDMARQHDTTEVDTVEDSLNKQEEERRQLRNEEHTRILEKCKEDKHSKGNEETLDDGIQEQQISPDGEDSKEKEESNEAVVEENLSVDDVDKPSDILEDYSASDDEEIAELLREEFRLKIEQEELLALSSRLKSRIQREMNDIDRLRLAIDEIRKKEDYATSNSSSEEDSSSEDSDSESATDSDSDNSEFENILKELQKENEKLENQTLDVLKALSEENAKCVDLKVQLRMLEDCRI